MVVLLNLNHARRISGTDAEYSARRYAAEKYTRVRQGLSLTMKARDRRQETETEKKTEDRETEPAEDRRIQETEFLKDVE